MNNKNSAKYQHFYLVLKTIGRFWPPLTISGQPNYLQRLHVMLNSLMEFQGLWRLKESQQQDGASKMRNTDNINVNRDIGDGAGVKVRNGPTTIFNSNSNQHPSSKNASTKAVLKGLHLKRPISRREISQTFEEFRRQNEEQIVSDIIKYETQLGRRHEWLDLLCRFSREELTIVEQELRWIYPHLFVPTNYKQTEMVIA